MASSAAYLARRAAQKERVRILYRRVLKDTLNWAVHRYLSYEQHLGTIDRLIDNAEATYCNKSRHPDLYIAPWAPGGSKFTRNQPLRQGGFFQPYITSAMTQVLNDSLETVSQTLISKSEMEKSKMLNESNLSNFKTEVQSSQDNHFAMLSCEFEKTRSKMESDNEKLRSELKSHIEKLRYEIDKASAGMRVDLQDLKVQLEAAELNVIKYCIGIAFSALTVGLGVMRFLN